MNDNPAACLAGEWTIHVIAQQREAMLELVNDGHAIFDVSGITDMDSAGLQLLMSAQRSLAQQGREINLLGTSDAVQAILQAYALDTTLQPISIEGSM